MKPRKTKSRHDFFYTLAQIMEKTCSKYVLDSIVEDYHYGNEYNLSTLTEALKDKYAGVTNGFLSEVFEMITDDYVEFTGEVENLYNCPCCGYKTLTEIFDINTGDGYDICPICRWEDDGTQDPRIRISINRGSMNDYRETVKNNPNYYYREKFKK